MKRRRFLQAVGVGSVGAGAMVGTGGYSRIRSQRRVKIEVDGKDDRAAISFVAFCFPQEDGRSKDDITNVVATDFKDDGEPIGIEWESEVEVQSVVLFGGNEFFNFPGVNATSSEVMMGERGTGEPGPGQPGGPPEAPGQPDGPPETPGRPDGQHPSTPCAFEEGKCGIKYEPPADPETESFVFDDSTC